MRVQNLVNSTMSPGNKRSELEAFGEPARVTVAEEITMWPAEVFNMGLLRSAWGRRHKCDLDIDAYRFKQNLWGRCPVVIELGDPLQMRPVQTVSLFDSQKNVKPRVAQGGRVSIESQWAIKAFKDFDCVFELTETKRFVPGDPIAPLLQSIRDADSAQG